jgi:hypothetical protein
MPDLESCSVTFKAELELVESPDGEADFVVATLSIDGEEQETLILPVEP